jgi:alpha-galactosidase
MERKIGCEMVVVLVTLLHVCVIVSSLGNNNYEDHFRRNLLANGLGKTPPMGYVTKFLLLTHILFRLSVS